MMLRLMHVTVVAALVLAAADVYKIKFESTLEAERVAKIRNEIRRERDAIGKLRAEWSTLDRPDRIQALARRHLALKPVEIGQYDNLDRLPEMPPQIVPPGSADPIGVMIETLADGPAATGSLVEPVKGR